MILYKVQVATDRFTLFEFSAETRGMLRMLAEAGRPLYWEYEGKPGKVPNGILREAFKQYDDWRALKERHPEAEMPFGMALFKWEQATTPRSPSAIARAQLLPLRHQESPQSEST